MEQRTRRFISTLSLVTAAVTLTGCGHDTTAGRDGTSSATSTAIRASAPLTLTPDIHACAGVQALIGHITVGTRRWSPNLAPFDKGMSSQIRVLSLDLEKQAPQAQTQHIQSVVSSNARAFRALADAMTGKNQRDVIQAIEATKVAYRDLKKVCMLKPNGGQ
jgi:hypothetical protein